MSSDGAGGTKRPWAAWLVALPQQLPTVHTAVGVVWSTWDCALLGAGRQLWHLSIALQLSLVPGGKLCLGLTGKEPQPAQGSVAQGLAPEHPVLSP